MASMWGVLADFSDDGEDRAAVSDEKRDTWPGRIRGVPGPWSRRRPAMADPTGGPTAQLAGPDELLDRRPGLSKCRRVIDSLYPALDCVGRRAHCDRLARELLDAHRRPTGSMFTARDPATSKRTTLPATILGGRSAAAIG